MKLTEEEVRTLISNAGDLDLDDVDTNNLGVLGAIHCLWAIDQSGHSMDTIYKPSLRAPVKKLGSIVAGG